MYKPIGCYEDFIENLLSAGFSFSSGNSNGIYSVIPFSWSEQSPCDTPVRWHTGDPETDPWEWRMRVLDERCDIAYAKLFMGKGGFITRKWAPSFLAARRENADFEDLYQDGLISSFAKRIYLVVREHGALPLESIKHFAGFSQQDKSKFDRALVELQMRLFLTMCGRQTKISRGGQAYGWSSTVFCTTESFWGQDVFQEAAKLKKPAAIDGIAEQIYRLNPNAKSRQINKFILG